MSEFKEFLDKVLAPIAGDAAGAEAIPSTIIVPAKPEASPANLSDDEIERRYVAVMNALCDDAQGRSAMHVFVDVVTWKLAVVGYHMGPFVIGDILRKIGFHLGGAAKIADARLALLVTIR